MVDALDLERRTTLLRESTRSGGERKTVGQSFAAFGGQSNQNAAKAEGHKIPEKC